MRRVWLWLPPLLYMTAIFQISAQPDPMPAITHAVWDKALHLIEYTVLSVLFCRALNGEGLAPLRVALFSILLTSTYGATDETHQLFVPDRRAGADDWLADSGGAAAGAALFNTVSRRRHPLRRSPPAQSNQPRVPAARAERPSASIDR
jgi:VanZ family protein